jgi:uncharacterized protein (TIGR03437 family)
MQDVTVRVGGVNAPLFYVSPTQINFQAPSLVPGSYPVTVTSASSGQEAASGSLTLVAAQPALFTITQQGAGQAAALNENNTPNAPGKEALAGSIIQLFGTGGGAFVNNPLEGRAATAATRTVLPATATVGGAAAAVLYSGAAPGLVGVWQVNVRIPPATRRDQDIPVVITIGGRPTNTVTIAVD